jgi:hypothetical protein
MGRASRSTAEGDDSRILSSITDRVSSLRARKRMCLPKKMMQTRGEGMEHQVPSSPESTVWTSRTLLSASVVILLALFLATYAGPSVASQSRQSFLCDTVREWRRGYAGDDLQIVVTDVTFHGSPAHFAVGEGTVIAPIAVDLPEAQQILDVRADPAPVRILHVEGVTEIAWDYAGTVHRDMMYRGLALVRRRRWKRVNVPAAPTFEMLPDPWSMDARQTAADLEAEEHRLDQCRAFVPKLKALAGDPPYTDQLKRIVERLQESRSDAGKGRRGEDLCAALRSGSLNVHQIQVLAVMALRELGAPSMGFTTPDPRRMYLVGTYVDGLGWVTIDANRPNGFESGGPPLITMAPLSSAFEAAQHGLWYASGAAYTTMFGRIIGFSTTRWSTDSNDLDDVTAPSSMPLEEACR